MSVPHLFLTPLAHGNVGEVTLDLSIEVVLDSVIQSLLTTVLAIMPVALAWREGSELQAPLARVVVGGLLSGTLITLVAIPLVCFVASPDRVGERDEDQPTATPPPELVHSQVRETPVGNASHTQPT